MDKDIIYWVGFSLIPGIGRVKFSRLEGFFGSLEDAWRAGTADFKQTGLDSASIRAINTWRPKISLDKGAEKLQRYGVQVVTHHDDNYPARLREIYDYPPLLYMRGALLPEDGWCLAVVGTCRATVYGRQVAEELTTDLARNQITIVSGLARGIDSIAYSSALSDGGRSLAVFACGLDTIYPDENAALARQMEMKEIIPASEAESQLLKHLSAEPTHIDEICHNSGLATADVSSTLAIMELKGLVEQVGTINYILAREARQEYHVTVD